ncbi:hypothetical protein ABEF93_006597 [Exophiala dermatitidis]
MMPQAALIILIIVVAVATITFLIALYHGLTTRLQSRKLKLRQSNESTPPLTEASPAPALEPAATKAPAIPAPAASALSTTSLLVHISPPLPPLGVSPKRSPTPEAESPPPLPEETTRAEGRRQRDSTIPRAESPPPLPKHLHTYTIEAESSRGPPSRREPNPLRTDGKGIKREQDSMHEIINLYTYTSSEARGRLKLPPVPKSAPATIGTFAQAESKWAYFGAKRAAEAEFHVV